MRVRLLTDGRYAFMKSVVYPLELEGEISESGDNIAVTPAQLEAAGVENVPTRFCAEVWYFTLGTEAEVITESDDE